jgi:putative oxidoreductase
MLKNNSNFLKKINSTNRTNLFALTIIIKTIRIGFGSIFIFSGCLKIMDINSFRTSLYKMIVINDVFIPYISIIIPLIEIILGLMILFNYRVATSSRILLYLLLMFTAIIVIKLYEGSDISCGCFGAFDNGKINFLTLIRNIFLIGISFILSLNISSHKDFSDKKDEILLNIKKICVISILFFLGVQNSVFSMENIELKNRIYRLIDKDLLLPGDQIKPFTLLDLSNNKFIMEFEHFNRTIIYIMKNGCKPCSENQKAWKIVYDNYKDNPNIKVIGICIDPISLAQELFNNYGIKYQFFYSKDDNLKANLKIMSTPLTIIINKGGTVENVFSGLLKTEDIKKITNNYK